MKKFMGVLVAGTMLFAGIAAANCGGETAGATCPHAKGACTAGDKQACAMKGAKSCAECAYLGETRTDLEQAGARVEVVKLKNGYVLMATATSPDTLAAVRKLNAERLGGLEALAGHTDKKFCKDCTAFNKALKADAVSVEVVDTANGVMTVFTGSTAEAVSSLKESCGMFSMLKAEAKPEKTTATN